MRAQEPARKDGPRINEEIRAREIHLIDKDGANRGNVSVAEALQLAQEAGLDLVEISPNAAPPIVNAATSAATQPNQVRARNTRRRPPGRRTFPA